MKNFTSIFSALIIIAATTTAQAITINPDDTVDGIIAADLMPDSSGIFYDWSSPDLISPSSQRDPAASITDDALVTTFAFSLDVGSYVDLGFSTSVYSGVGDDLAFFMVGNPSTIDFSAVVSDDFGNNLSITNAVPYDVQWIDNLNVGGQLIALNMILIDLNDYGSDVFGINPLSNIQFNFGSEFNSPGLSLVGGIHDVAIPLPLPVILFGSGLGLLGLFARKKS